MAKVVWQKNQGYLLGHVYDLLGDNRSAPVKRAHHTSTYLSNHSDFCGFVGLLCLLRAKAAGPLSIANEVVTLIGMPRRRPDLVEV